VIKKPREPSGLSSRWAAEQQKLIIIIIIIIIIIMSVLYANDYFKEHFTSHKITLRETN
jgi:hypothetical protein